MVSIQQLLDEKNRPLVSVAPTDTVQQALALLARHDIGAVLVLDKGNVAGIFSERDFARKVGLPGRSFLATTVREVMSDHVFYVTPAQTVEECLAIMTDRHIRHLPVVSEAQKLLGILSIGDLVKATISLQAFRIEQLERYITG
jgi:CBS domain-containing protein